MREAKREIKERIMAEMFPPPAKKLAEDEPTKEELEAKERKEKETIKAKEKEEKEAKKAAKAAKLEAAQAELAGKEAAKEARRQAKKDRKAQKAANKVEMARRITEQKAEKAKRAKDAKQTNGDSTKLKSLADGFLEGTDEIKLRDGREAPGAGLADKSSKKKDKKQKKLEAQALEAGLTVEEYMANQKQQKEGKQAQVNGDAEMADGDVPLTNGIHVAEDAALTVNMLSGKKKEKYAARAAEKGMTVEAYLARRVQKKVAAGIPITAAAAPSNTDALFAVDIAGDASLTSQPADKARLEWMRAHHAERNLAKGKNPLTKKEHSKKKI